MLLPITSAINENNTISIGGCDVFSLKAKHKTPLYIIDIKTVKKQCSDYIKFFKFPGYDSEIIYASKVFCTLAMCQLVRQEGLSIDVSTGGELFTALRSGFEPQKIFFHGNNKSSDEIKFGIDYNVGTFVVDNLDELKTINKIAAQKDIVQKIMLRITPGIKAHTHKYIQTGSIESKFGFSIHTGAAFKAVKKASKLENIKLTGIHAHIGSQIFNIEVYDKLVDTMIKFIKDIDRQLDVKIKDLNIGGGLGIKYISSDKPPSIEEFAGLVNNALESYTKKYDVEIDRIYVEPGRSIIGNAGTTLYEVGVIKEIPGIKNYISVDGGMSDNIRPILYQAKYNAFIANRAEYLKGIEEGEIINTNDAGNLKKYTIVGKHCESGDVLIEGIMLPAVKSGDLLLVSATGAYCYSMANNYNGQPKSAIVAVEDGRDWLWVERQSYEDLVMRDRKLYE